MLISIGHGLDPRFELEVRPYSLFLRAPMIGEIFTAKGHGWSRSTPKEIRECEAARAKRRAELFPDLFKDSKD